MRLAFVVVMLRMQSWVKGRMLLSIVCFLALQHLKFEFVAFPVEGEEEYSCFQSSCRCLRVRPKIQVFDSIGFQLA